MAPDALNEQAVRGVDVDADPLLRVGPKRPQ